NTVFSFRIILAIMWLFDGIWHHISERAAEAPKFGSLAEMTTLSGETISIFVGVVEVILALFVASGLTFRLVAFVQVLAVMFLLWISSVDFMGTVSDIVLRLPQFAAITMVFLYGPGTFCLEKNRRRQTWTRG